MDSKLTKALQLKNEAVAVYRSDSLPEGALQFKPGVWGCVAAMLNAAAKGRTAAFCDETTVCVGGRAGLGLAPYPHGYIEKFLSDGEDIDREGERYKQSAELALEFMDNIPQIAKKKYVVFMPLSKIDEKQQTPEAVVFLVDPDRLSALVTLANFDARTPDTVKVLFGAGCTQSVLYALAAFEKQSDECYLGMTDLSARKCIDKNHLSFSIPYNRYLAMEANTDSCFFRTETWQIISRRLE